MKTRQRLSAFFTPLSAFYYGFAFLFEEEFSKIYFQNPIKI